MSAPPVAPDRFEDLLSGFVARSVETRAVIGDVIEGKVGRIVVGLIQ